MGYVKEWLSASKLATATRTYPRGSTSTATLRPTSARPRMWGEVVKRENSGKPRSVCTEVLMTTVVAGIPESKTSIQMLTRDHHVKAMTMSNLDKKDFGLKSFIKRKGQQLTPLHREKKGQEGRENYDLFEGGSSRQGSGVLGWEDFHVTKKHEQQVHRQVPKCSGLSCQVCGQLQVSPKRPYCWV